MFIYFISVLVILLTLTLHRKVVRLPHRRKIHTELDLMFMKHYALNRCLYIKVAKLRTGGGAETKLQCQTIQRALQSPNLQREIIQKK